MKLNPFKWFKKEKLEYPEEYEKVVLNNVAKMNNINDNFNKKIVKYKNGKIVEVRDYIPEDVEFSLNVEEIPVINEELEDSYDFLEGNKFGEVVK